MKETIKNVAVATLIRALTVAFTIAALASSASANNDRNRYECRITYKGYYANSRQWARSESEAIFKAKRTHPTAEAIKWCVRIDKDKKK